MFSIEMLAVLSIVIFAISAVTVFSTSETVETSFIELTNLNNSALGLYLENPESIELGDQVACNKVSYFDDGVKAKNYCEGV